MKNQAFLLALMCFSLNSFAQSPSTFAVKKYSVNSEIDQQIQKHSFSKIGILKNSMTFKVPWDSDTIFNQRDPIDCYTESFLRNDTIYIEGSMVGKLGFGFQLRIFGDSCIITSYALSDGEMYKYQISDKKILSFILLPSVNQKLILAKKPTFKEGENVSGLVELISQDFYYVMGKSNKKASITLKAYFKTAPIKKSY